MDHVYRNTIDDRIVKMQGKSMIGFTKEKLQKLREDMKYARQSIAEVKKLNEKRTLIENELLTLQKGTKTGRLPWINGKIRNNDPAVQEKLDLLKREKQELDDALDTYEVGGELPLKEIEIRQQAVELIIAQFPDESIEYQSFEIDLQKKKRALLRIEMLLDVGQEVQRSLGMAITVWKQSLRRSLLDYLFGRSPATKITLLLKDVKEKSERALLHFSKESDEATEESHMQSIFENLSQLVVEQWGSITFSNHYLPLYEKLEEGLIKLQRLYQIKHTEIDQADIKINQWIDRFCDQ